MSTAGEKKLNAVENETAGERAASLGRAGMRLRTAIENLRSVDLQALSAEERAELVNTAAEALAAYVVQREALGLYDMNNVTLEYQVSLDVWSRIGASNGSTFSH